MANSQSFDTAFVFLNIISGDFGSYFIELIMRTLTPTRIGEGSVAFPSKGPTRSEYIYLLHSNIPMIL